MMEDIEKSGDSSVSYDDLGLTKPRKATEDTIFFGKTRVLSDLSKLEIGFIIISAVSLLSTIGLTIERIYVAAGCNHKNLTDQGNATDCQGVSPDDLTYAIVLLVNAVITCYYIIHGIFKERGYEIVIFCIAVILLVIYLVVNFVKDPNSKENIVKLVRLSIAAILASPDVIIGLLIAKDYFESGNLVFRTVGAREELQKACKLAFFFQDLLKFDFQAEISMLILVIQDGELDTLKEKLVLGIGFPLSILWLILGFLVVVLEKRYLAGLFIGFGLFEPCYVLYRMITVYSSGGSGALSAAIYACGSIALAVRIVLLVTLIFVIRNFGLGLKEKAYPTVKCFQDARDDLPPEREESTRA